MYLNIYCVFIYLKLDVLYFKDLSMFTMFIKGKVWLLKKVSKKKKNSGEVEV